MTTGELTDWCDAGVDRRRVDIVPALRPNHDCAGTTITGSAPFLCAGQAAFPQELQYCLVSRFADFQDIVVNGELQVVIPEEKVS